MSPAPRRKVTGARPTAIGAKATTPSQASRTIASRNGGAATRAQGAAAVDWDAVIKRFKRDMRRRAAEERAASRDETEKAVCGQTDQTDPKGAQRSTWKAGIDTP